LHRAIGAPIRRDCDANYVQAVIERLHAALSDDAYQAAWTAGIAMSFDEAIAEAAIVPVSQGTNTPAPPSTTSARHGLTPREIEVLRLVVEGYSDKEIAAALFIGRRTVSGHVTSILAKLGLSSRTAAASFAVRHELV
jgi:DNA-binding NarL/FixJ family response regulator